MKIKKPIICLLFVLLLSSQTPIFSQVINSSAPDTVTELKSSNPKQKILYRSKGDMTFSLNLGVLLPLFMLDFSDGSVSKVNTSVGGLFSVGWDVYLSTHFRLGAQVSPSFCYTPNNLLYMVPLTVRCIYEIQPVKQISIPLYIGTGLAFTTYRETFKTDLFLKPGIGFHYNWDVQWSFGVDVNYWWLLEFDKDRSNNRAASFLELSATVHYHF